MTFLSRLAKINLARNALFTGEYSKCAQCKFQPSHTCDKHARMFGSFDGQIECLNSQRNEAKEKLEELRRHTDTLWTAQVMNWSEMNATERLIKYLTTEWDLPIRKEESQ